MSVHERVRRPRRGLFPAEVGRQPLAWLIYWVIPLIYMVCLHAPWQQMGIAVGLMLVFLVLYREFYFAKGYWRYALVAAQLLIVCILIWLYGDGYLFMGCYGSANVAVIARTRRALIAGLAAILLALTGALALAHPLSWQYLLDAGGVAGYITVAAMPLFVRGSLRWRKLNAELRETNRQLERLTQEGERQRIARDLHDTLGHTLSLIALKSELAERLIRVNPDQASIEIRDVRDSARAALTQVRELVSNLHSVDLYQELHHVRSILSAAGIKLARCEVDDELDTGGLRGTVLAMCLREAITNVVRHSGADLCEIQVERTDEGTRLSVRDDGRGVDPRVDLVKGQSTGLRGMRERVALVGGTLELSSVVPRGALVSVFLPHVISGSVGRTTP